MFGPGKRAVVALEKIAVNLEEINTQIRQIREEQHKSAEAARMELQNAPQRVFDMMGTIQKMLTPQPTDTGILEVKKNGD